MSDIKITNINGKDLKYLSLEIKENVGVITINNPPVNALSEQAYTEVGDIFEYVNSRDDIWVCIFRAEGKTYPVGLDVHGFLDNIANDRQLESAETFYRSTLAVYNCRVPVISAVQGFALGGGLCYAAGSDFIIAAEGAKFGFPEVKLGVVGGGAHLPRLVPPIVSRNMMFTGEFISAEDLYKFGGITQIVPREKLDEAAMILHEEYYASQFNAAKQQESIKPWSELAEEYRESCRLKADYRELIKRAYNNNSEIKPDNLIECLAQMEHRRWCVEKVFNGWSYGANRNDQSKTNPLLTKWENLSETDKEYNREDTRKFIKSVGINKN